MARNERGHEVWTNRGGGATMVLGLCCRGRYDATVKPAMRLWLDALAME